MDTTDTERRLFVVWDKLKAEYIASNISYRELAKKYDVSFNTLKDIAVGEQWYKLRQQAHNNATTKIVKAVSDKNAKIDDKYFSLVDKLMEKAEETIRNTPVWSVNALKEMTTALKNLKECKGVKSEADIREQEARIAKLQKEAQEEDGATDITVILEGDLEKYSK